MKQESVIIDLKYVLINFDFKNERSGEATLKRPVNIVLRTIAMFGKAFRNPFSTSS